MKLTVEVTDEDIRCGTPRNSWRCPIALAMLRKTGEPWQVGVVWLMMAGTFTQIATPPALLAFMSDFDHIKPVNPFTFTLEVPDGLWKG